MFHVSKLRSTVAILAAASSVAVATGPIASVASAADNGPTDHQSLCDSLHNSYNDLLLIAQVNMQDRKPQRRHPGTKWTPSRPRPGLQREVRLGRPSGRAAQAWRQQARPDRSRERDEVTNRRALRDLTQLGLDCRCSLSLTQSGQITPTTSRLAREALVSDDRRREARCLRGARGMRV